MNLGDLFVTVGAKIDGFRDAMSQVKGSLSDTSADLKTIGTQMTAALTLPLVGLGVAALKTAGELEQNSIAFRTMMGSAEAAMGHLEELKRFAMTTPFQFSDLTLASKRLQALGFEAKQVVPILTTVGDAAAALGMGAEGIQRITTALGQMQAKGKVQAEEMRQLAEAGIPAWQILAKTLETDVAGAMKLVEKRAVDASVAIPALLAGMNEKFGGLMKEQAGTLLGQWSNIKDQIAFTLTDVGNAIMPIAKRIMDNFVIPVLGAVKELAKGFGMLPEPVQQVTIALLAITAAIGPMTFAIGHAISAFTSLSSIVLKVGSSLAAFGTAATSVGGLTGAFTSLTGALNPVALGLVAVAAAATVLYIEFQKATTQVKSLDKEFGDFVTKMVTSTKDFEGSRAKLDAALSNNALSLDQYNKALAILEDREKKALGKELTEQFGLGLTIVGKEAPKAAEGVDKLGAATTGLKKTLKESTTALHEFVGPMTPLLDKMIAAESASRAQARLRKLVDEVVNLKEAGLGVGMELEVVWSDLSHNVEEFREQVIETTPVIAEMVDIDPTAGEQAMQRIKDAMTQTAIAGKGRFSELGRDIELVFHRTFDGLGQALGRMITDWKGGFDAIKKLGQNFAEDMMGVFVKALFEPLENEFAKLGAKIGKALGDLLGIGGGAASTVAGGAGTAGSAGGAAGGAGGAVSSGLSGVVGAITGVVSAVSGVIGNFQMFGMNKSLDLTVNHTLVIANEIQNLRRDEWDRHAANMKKWDDIWGTLLDIYDLLGKGIKVAGTGGASFVNSVGESVADAIEEPMAEIAEAIQLPMRGMRGLTETMNRIGGRMVAYQTHEVRMRGLLETVIRKGIGGPREFPNIKDLIEKPLEMPMRGLRGVLDTVNRIGGRMLEYETFEQRMRGTVEAVLRKGLPGTIPSTGLRTLNPDASRIDVTINVNGASDPETTSRVVAAHLKRVSPKFANLAV